MGKKKILLVEDNEDDILLIQRAFSKTNLSDEFELIVARDGNQAISYLNQIEDLSNYQQNALPTIVLLDLKLPRIDGFEVLEQIKNDGKKRLIPVVVFTSSREEKDITKAYTMGANSYVRKPVDSEKFSFVLKQIANYWSNINEVAF